MFGRRCHDHVLPPASVWPRSRSATMVGARRSSDVDPILSATGTADTINVTTLQQGVINDPTQCSLQEAIYAAEFKSNTAVSQTDPDVTYNTGCTAGTGDDIILLAP